MSRLSLKLAVALLLAAPAGLATAQVSLRGSHASGGFPAASNAGAPGVRALSSAPVLPPASEPKSMEGMLAAQNDARTRVGLPALAWSLDLTAKADAVVRIEAKGYCRPEIVDRLEKAPATGVYWAGETPQLSGEGAAQNILPSYVVSQWRSGRSNYDFSTGQCRNDGDTACVSFSRMVAPTAKSVGCSKATCTGGAQVWVCQYSNQ